MDSSFRPKMRCRAGVHPVALLAVVLLAGCQAPQREPTISANRAQAIRDKTFLYYAVPGSGEYPLVNIDPDTGCEEIVNFKCGFSSCPTTLTPRLDGAGKQICKALPQTPRVRSSASADASLLRASPIPPQGQDQ